MKNWFIFVGLMAMIIVCALASYNLRHGRSSQIPQKDALPVVPNDWAHPLSTTLDKCAVRTQVAISAWNLYVTDNSTLVVSAYAKLDHNTPYPIYIQKLENNDCEIIIPKKTVTAIQFGKLHRTSYPHLDWYYPVTKIEQEK